MSPRLVWDVIQWFHFLSLSLWIGGITFLSAIVAPSVHHSVVSRAVAGEIVGHVLRRLNKLEIFCFLILIATSFLSFRFIQAQNKTSLWIVIAVILGMGTVTSVYSFRIAPLMATIKENVPTLDTLSEDNPSKMQFKRLHRLYVLMMSGNLILGLCVLYASIRILR